MRSKEELIQIYEDTMSLAYKYDEPLSAKIFNLTQEDYVKNMQAVESNSVAKIWTENIDCVEAAKKLQDDQTCILNMASYKHPGGGVKRGTMSQEEELSRRSMLMKGLPEEYYPLTIDQFIYTEHVVFMKDQNYQVMQDFACDVITIAAINLNEVYGVKEIGHEEIDFYFKWTRKKIQAILWEPYNHGCENLVLSAFGCGVFKNNPYTVAKLFKEEIDKGFSKLYKNIVFAIYNDHNSVSDNFQAFKDVIG